VTSDNLPISLDCIYIVHLPQLRIVQKESKGLTNVQLVPKT